MMMRKWIVVAFVAAMIAGAGLAPLPAQFGDLVGDFLELDGNMLWNGVVYDAPGTGRATNRRFMRGDGWFSVGLADAASDLVTATTSTMSSTYQTIMSATVDVGEQGDRVLIHVGAQIGRMGAGLYVSDTTDNMLWAMVTPSDTATQLGTFATLAVSDMATSDGALYLLSRTVDALYRMPDPSSLGSLTMVGNFPSGLDDPRAMTDIGGILYIVESRFLWKLIDKTDPGSATLVGELQSQGVGVTSLGVADIGGDLYYNENFNAARDLYRQVDPDDTSTAVLLGEFPSGLAQPRAMTEHGGDLYIVDRSGNELWVLEDLTSPGSATLVQPFPSGIGQPFGLASIGAGPCDIRIARDLADVETITLNEGRILFDTTFVDQPPAGTYAYSLQYKTSDPNTLCTAYRGEGDVPLPSLLVQVFYGE